MRLLAPVLFLVALAPVTSAAAEPLICVDPGALEVEGVIKVDPPEVCVL